MALHFTLTIDGRAGSGSSDMAPVLDAARELADRLEGDGFTVTATLKDSRGDELDARTGKPTGRANRAVTRENAATARAPEDPPAPDEPRAETAASARTDTEAYRTPPEPAAAE